jgi:DNA segregation ATPase FtsK/SpoIIIE-like protein
MDASSLTLGLSELRRQLEEILALVSRDARDDAAAEPEKSSPAPSMLEPGHIQNPPGAFESHENPVESRENQANRPDELFDDALVVVTEFGQATPAILQMWLTIDYARAARILEQLEASGLVSAKGRVRHKAYELLRSENVI